MKLFKSALAPFISNKTKRVAMTVLKPSPFCYCRKLHVLEPRYYCNSMNENICNKFAVTHHLKRNFCLQKVWGNFLHVQQSFQPISSPEPIRHFFLPEDASRLEENKTNNRKFKVILKHNNL